MCIKPIKIWWSGVNPSRQHQEIPKALVTEFLGRKKKCILAGGPEPLGVADVFVLGNAMEDVAEIVQSLFLL